MKSRISLILTVVNDDNDASASKGVKDSSK